MCASLSSAAVRRVALVDLSSGQNGGLLASLSLLLTPGTNTLGLAPPALFELFVCKFHILLIIVNLRENHYFCAVFGLNKPLLAGFVALSGVSVTVVAHRHYVCVLVVWGGAG